MPREISISHSRRDNQQGRVTRVVQGIHVEGHAFAGGQLPRFFDATKL